MATISTCEEAWVELRKLGAPGRLNDKYSTLQTDEQRTDESNLNGIYDPPNYFFPRDKLLGFFTYRLLKKLLWCHCGSCEKDRGLVERLHGPQHLESTLSRIVPPVDNSGTDPALAFFSLLLYVRHPQLILTMLIQNCTDSDLKAWCKERLPPESTILSVLEIHLGEDKKYQEDIAGTITREMYRFMVPEILDSKLVDYHNRVILPFYEEKYVGKGAFGKVYSFKIYEGYYKMTPIYETFARKQIAKRRTSNYPYREVTAMNLVNGGHAHPHIIPLVKSYDHGELFNIIMPFAETNLNQCLRSHGVHFDQSISTASLKDWVIWKQILGIAEALNTILTKIVDENNEPILAYHFDLKPANILVSGRRPQEFVMCIGDFGLSTQKSSSTDSLIERPQAGGVYSPPERHEVSRKYDIWSLGCILLEVTAFGIDSYKGVVKLDDARNKGSFWTTNKKSRLPQVHEGVTNFLDYLSARVSDRAWFPASDSNFAHKIIELIRKMLCVYERQRINSEQVVEQLRSLLVPGPSGQHDIGRGKAVLGEIELGEASTLRSISARAPRYDNTYPVQESSSVILQIFEHPDEQRLRIFTTDRNTDKEPRLVLRDKRQDIAIVPKYAMMKSGDLHRDSSIQLFHVDHFWNSACEVHFDGELQDLRKLQSILLGQDIRYSIQLQEIKSEIPRPQRKFPYMKKPEEKSAQFHALEPTIQLWAETVSEQTSGSNPYRVVIYYENKIVFIPLSREWRLTKLSDAELLDLDKKDLQAGAEHKSEDRFLMQVFEVRSHNDKSFLPSIPLSKEVFNNQLSSCDAEFTRFHFFFHSHKDTIDFYNAYLKLKEKYKRGQ